MAGVHMQLTFGLGTPCSVRHAEADEDDAIVILSVVGPGTTATVNLGAHDAAVLGRRLMEQAELARASNAKAADASAAGEKP